MTDTKKKSLSEMAKEVEEQKGADRVEEKLVYDGIAADGALRNFLRLAESIPEFEINLTLFVEGTIVSGTLIGGKKFWRLQREKFVEGGFSEEIALALTDYDSVYAPPAEGKPAPLLNFVHLKDARVQMHDANIEFGGDLLWRGKLKAVSAYTFGKIISQRD